ncbi:classical arabinogalactan protein 9-like [Miscanthus floridulus]|uniref:classical arabinogalactan protein 9-like n=1 Tax=Miscanthus floridulus TaxID=154761 RepID=UPI003457694C
MASARPVPSTDASAASSGSRSCVPTVRAVPRRHGRGPPVAAPGPCTAVPPPPAGDARHRIRRYRVSTPPPTRPPRLSAPATGADTSPRHGRLPAGALGGATVAAACRAPARASAAPAPR